MPKYFFDYEDCAGVSIDDMGDEFRDADAATREALLALGDAARDHTQSNLKGRLAIRIRDDEGPILEVSAMFEVSRIRH